MLNLDALIDPNFDCVPLNPNCCPTSISVTCCTTECPPFTRYILEKCNEHEVTEVVRIHNQYDVLGNVIIIDDVCYTVTEITHRLVTVYWTPGTIYETCTEAGCPTPPVTCTIYNISIQSPAGGTLYYKDCTGQVITEDIPITKAIVTYPRCGISGQTDTDIYFVGTVPVFNILDTAIPC